MKLRHLDILRALLALMVLVGHARMLLWMPWQEWRSLPHEWWELAGGAVLSFFRFGNEAVLVFFALSGFFIHLRAAQQAANAGNLQFDARNYLGRRARRILPPYYAALAFTCLVDAFGHHWFPRLYLAQTGDEIVDNSFSNAGYTLSSVLPALFAQPSLLSMRFGGNGPLWSIGHEVFYYAVYPLFMLVWTRRRKLAYVLGIGAGFLCYVHPFLGWWSKMLIAYPVWLAGAWLADLACLRPTLLSKSRLTSLLCCLAAFGALAGVRVIPESNAFHLLLCMIMGTAAIAAFLTTPFDLSSARMGQLLEWLGVRSYSLYIFHFPAVVLTAAWCFQTLGERPSHVWLAFLGSVFGLGAGLLGFQLVERHFLPRRQLG